MVTFFLPSQGKSVQNLIKQHVLRSMCEIVKHPEIAAVYVS